VQEAALNDTAKKEEWMRDGQLEAKKATSGTAGKDSCRHAGVSNKRRNMTMKARIENIHGRIDFSSEENSTYEKEIEKSRRGCSNSLSKTGTSPALCGSGSAPDQKEEYRSTLEREIAELKNKNSIHARNGTPLRTTRFSKEPVEVTTVSRRREILITNDA